MPRQWRGYARGYASAMRGPGDSHLRNLSTIRLRRFRTRAARRPPERPRRIPKLTRIFFRLRKKFLAPGPLQPAEFRTRLRRGRFLI